MKILIFIAAITVCFSCNTNDKTAGSTHTTETQVINNTDTIYITRNADVTPANSYSDLFLDSNYVTQFIQANNVSGDDDKRFRSFYNYRNMQFAWFTSQGLTEQAKGFWNLQDQLGSKADKSLRNRMDTLLNMGDTLAVSRYDTSVLRTELALTKAYLDFYKNNRSKTQFGNISPEMAIPVKKVNTMAYADTLTRQAGSGSDTAMANANSQYVKLRQKLQQYTSAAKQGGLPVITGSARSMRKGASSPMVSTIKKRLQMTGDMPAGDTSAVYNDTLVNVIKNYQMQYGMAPTGVITDTLIRALNVPVENRIQQIIINMNRAQWMPAQQQPTYLSVNIPDFLLTVFENNTKVFDMPVAVGKEGTNTTMFNGDLNQVVFSPNWNIPASIVKNEILPKMKSDPNYLKSRNMEIVGGKNDSVPTIRQLPGKENSLGKVKFLFPNRYDIYLHDTPAKDVFNKKNRAVSHGCIRVADAEKLANYLLRNTSGWTPEKVNAAMNANKEQYVKLSPAIPVQITYYTAWVNDAGQVNFRDDIYENDKKISQMMFENPSMVMNSLATTDTARKDTVKRTPVKDTTKKQAPRR